MFRFSVLASGSKGNACYVETAEACVLVDAGLSCREMERRLTLLDLSASRLDAIILTHEHVDHIRGAGVMARRYALPVYATEGTISAGARTIGKLPRFVPVETGARFAIKDLVVEPFTKCHDASDPFALTLSCDGMKLGIATDLGRSTRLVEDKLQGCNALIMEFNHDPDMLENGPYPLFLKRRIKGPEGHLSNGEGACLVNLLAHESLDCVVCAHLSEINNNPFSAHEEARRSLVHSGFGKVQLIIAEQGSPGALIELRDARADVLDNRAGNLLSKSKP
ncbi:MAG TPA: MBL fold metallo-hydrolase [Desulfobacteraceae bacterium]|nr:MBL fold metallo-hydrolase [Desulfobacteraceae bacterium]